MVLYLNQNIVLVWLWFLSCKKTTLPFTAIEVEAMAAKRALELALETGFDRVILECEIDTHLGDSSHSLSNFAHMVKDIQYLASCWLRENNIIKLKDS